MKFVLGLVEQRMYNRMLLLISVLKLICTFYASAHIFSDAILMRELSQLGLGFVSQASEFLYTDALGQVVKTQYIRFGCVICLILTLKLLFLNLPSNIASP